MLQKSIGSGKKVCKSLSLLFINIAVLPLYEKQVESPIMLKSGVKTLFGDSFHLKISSSMNNRIGWLH